jgi:hypothetical protein
MPSTPHLHTSKPPDLYGSLRGACSSIRLGPSRVLVNINVATGAFFKEGLSSDLMAAIIPHQGDLRNSFRLKQMEKLLKGLRIITGHTKLEEKAPESRKEPAGAEVKTVQKLHIIDSFWRQNQDLAEIVERSNFGLLMKVLARSK